MIQNRDQTGILKPPCPKKTGITCPFLKVYYRKLHKSYFSNSRFSISVSLVLLLITNTVFYAANNPKPLTTSKNVNTVFFVDTDGDGVDDTVDLDDDNDGILDIYENCVATTSFFDNYDFEEYSGIPYNLAQLYKLNSWNQATNATSDFLHANGFRGNYEVNVSTPTPSGKGYVGSMTEVGAWVEYIGSNLNSILEAGVTYELNMLLGSADAGFTYGGDYNGDFVIYGFAAPQTFPLNYHREANIEDPNAIELVREQVSITASTWTEEQFTFTPTQDLYAIMIGAENDDFSYVLYDRLLLRGMCTNTEDLDTDGDGIVNRLDLDSDNDGISDLEESGTSTALFDIDQNGVIDGSAFIDSDTDGLADGLETIYGADKAIYPRKTDADDYYDFLDLDSDADGIPDTIEAFPTTGYIGNDGDVSNEDADGDGIIALFDTNDTTTLSFGGNFTSPQNTDLSSINNSDLLPDYLDVDSDGDTILDVDEGGSAITNTTYQDPNGSVNNPQTDLPDAIVDTDEVDYREIFVSELDEVLNKDTDDDGIPDVIDIDDDNDGILDTVESCIRPNSYLPNYEFEDYSQLPNALGQIDRLNDWYYGTFGSSDYYHTDSNGVATPNGKGYVGMLGISENLAANVTQVLLKDREYTIDILIAAGEVINSSGIVANESFQSDFTVYGFTSPQTSFPVSSTDWEVFAHPDAVQLLKEPVNLNGGAWQDEHFTFTPPENIYAILIQMEGVTRYVLYDRVLLREACNPLDELDTDGDGIPNRLDLDSDNDGISDLEESGADVTSFDPDQNGVIDGASFTDTDTDGLADGIEEIHGENTGTPPLKTDQDEYPNFIDLDSDADGIPDTIEAFPTSGYVGNDGDVSDEDADGDGIISQFDANDTSSSDFGGSFTAPQNTDVLISVNPDNLPDYIDTDSDGDGALDSNEGGNAATNVTYEDTNGNINTPLSDLLDDILGNNEVAYRESCIPAVDYFDAVLVCGDTYSLPSLSVPNANFYTLPNGGGTLLNTGDIIPITASPITIYVFAETGTVPNCVNQDSFTITKQDTPLIDAVSDVIVCDSYILPEITGANLNKEAQYFTAPNGGGFSINSGDVLDYGDFLRYPVTLYAYYVNENCTSQQSFTLHILKAPTVAPISDVEVCDTYTLPQIQGSDITEQARYYTETNAGGDVYNAGDVFDFTTFASYPVTLYAYDAASGGSCGAGDEKAFELVIYETPSITPISEVITCDSYTLPEIAGTNLSANTSYYTESDGGGTSFEAGDVLTFTDFDTYPVTLYAYDINASGTCSNEQSFELTLFETPILDAIADAEACGSYTLPEITGTSITENAAYFTAANGNGATYAIGDIINFTDFDAYPVTLYAYDTNSNVPCTSEQNFMLTLYHSPVLNPIAAVLACESYTLPELSGTNLNPTATYFTQTGGAGDSYASGDVISYSDFNSYPVTLYAYDTNEACSTEQSFAINILASILLPTPRLNSLNCEEGTTANSVEVILASNQITGGNGSYNRFQFVWDNNTPENIADDIILQDGSETTYLETDPSEKRIVINVYDSENCSASTEIIIPERTALNAEITSIQQNVCVNENDGNIAIAFSGGYPPYTVKLQNEFGRNTLIETTRENEYTFNFLEGGLRYDISITDSKNCSITLAQALAPAVDLSAATEINYFCTEGGAITQNEVNIILEQDLANEVIFTLDGDESTAQLSPIFNNVAAGEHTLEIAHENGCVNNRLSFSIQSILPIELSLTTPGINTIKAAAMGGSGNYQYSFNGQAFGRNTAFVIFETGTYSLTARDANNCEATQVVFLEFLPIIVPDHFTPNDDSGWKPLNMEGYPNADIKIYDRYGRFITQLEVNEEWHGFYQGSDLPSGDYWYTIRLNSPVNRQELIGHFTMIR